MNNITLLVLVGVFAVIGALDCEQAHSAEEPVIKSRYKILTIKTEMGSESLAAYFDVKGSQGVIFVPGKVFNKESWFFLTERLQQVNVASLALDGKEKSDVLSAIGVMKDKGFKKIALVGGSMGGAAILQALEEKTDDSINKVVVLAPYGGSPIKSKIITKLFVVAKEDRLGIYPGVQKVYIDSSDPKKIVEFDGTEHAQHLFRGPNKEKLSRLIVDFLRVDED